MPRKTPKHRRPAEELVSRIDWHLKRGIRSATRPGMILIAVRALYGWKALAVKIDARGRLDGSKLSKHKKAK